MQIEINGEIEQLIKAAMASGRFASPEECVESMARNWHLGRPLPGLPELAKSTNINALAMEQGVRPFDASEQMPVDIWPADESTDEFLAFLRASRQEEQRPGMES